MKVFRVSPGSTLSPPLPTPPQQEPIPLIRVADLMKDEADSHSQHHSGGARERRDRAAASTSLHAEVGELLQLLQISLTK